METILVLAVWGVIFYRIGYKRGIEVATYEYERKLKYRKDEKDA